MGGLRWCASGEAVEYAETDPAVGCTFAMSGEIALFLEGFGAGGRLIGFSFILHLLHLIGLGMKGAGDGPGEPIDARRAEPLARRFRAEGRPLRNAGALCAALCRDVPRVPDPPEVADLCEFLSQVQRGAAAWCPNRPHHPPAAVPPLEPREFEDRVFRALAGFTAHDLEHWLRHGRGPIGEAGEQVARQAEVSRPRTLREALAALGRRPRLAEAAPLVPHLAGALALPSRRLAPVGLPVGGYADVTTRGQPEQILPAQFALDDLEFLRRFAGRELLYFHREEPRTATDEEVVLVVDQGVRTWGDVRLVLSAAALALGRQAARRKARLLVAATSGNGRLLDALESGPDALGALLEASDLTADPGAALRRALETRPARRLRDVVLLTHPRTLATPAVGEAAREVAAGTRLFAVAVDGDGQVTLSELRSGVPIVLSRCRVTIPDVLAEPVPSRVAPGTWTGDVEPIGFPFRLGVTGPIDDRLFDFDDSGAWLLAATGRMGLLHAWRTDGTAAEMLPRPMVEGKLIDAIEAVLGVEGGFVVGGRCRGAVVAAHYDLTRRSCAAHVLSTGAWESAHPSPVPYRWNYDRRFHSIVVGPRPGPERAYAVDLGAERETACFGPQPSGQGASRRARLAAFVSRVHAPFVSRVHAPAPLEIVSGDSPSPSVAQAIRLDPSTGTIEAHTEWEGLVRVTPHSDGRPALRNGRLIQARCTRGVLAVLADDSAWRRSLYLFAARGGEVLAQYPVGSQVQGFALSRGGRRFARRIDAQTLEVREVGGGVAPLLVTTRARVHTELDVVLGHQFLTIRAGKFFHLLRWDSEQAVVLTSTKPPGAESHVPWLAIGKKAVGRGGLTYDPRRFVARCAAGGLTAWVDRLGHVVLLDDAGVPVCYLFVFRNLLAVWLPDGSRMGPTALTGGPPSPDIAGRLAAALRQAAKVQRLMRI